MSNIYIQEPPTNGKVLLTTTAGEIEVELWSKEAPLACRNFVQLCLEGYYDGTVFHRVIPGFIAQGGDPLGTGEGGESIYGKPFKDEFHSRLRFVRRGLVACANSGPNDNGSQFFFSLGECKELHNKHTIFGKVAGDTLYNLPRFEEGEIDKDDRPVYPQKISKTEVLVNPFTDIVPREAIANEIPKEDRKKKKKKGVKNFSLLSFGGEAEEEEALVITATREMGSAGGTEPSLLNPEEVDMIPPAEREGAKERIRAKLMKLTALEAKDSSSDKFKNKEMRVSGNLPDRAPDIPVNTSPRKAVDTDKKDKSVASSSSKQSVVDKNLKTDEVDSSSHHRKHHSHKKEKKRDRSEERDEKGGDRRREKRRRESKEDEAMDGEGRDKKRRESKEEEVDGEGKDEKPAKGEENKGRNSNKDKDGGDRKRDDADKLAKTDDKKSSKKRRFSADAAKDGVESDEKKKRWEIDSEEKKTNKIEEKKRTIEEDAASPATPNKEDRSGGKKDAVEKMSPEEEVELEKAKKLSEMRAEIKQLKRELTGKDTKKKSKDEENQENNKDLKQDEEQPPSALQEYKLQKEKYMDKKRTIPKKGSKREDITLALMEKFNNKVKSALTVAEEKRAHDDVEEEKGGAEDDEEDDWLRHRLVYDTDAPVLARDASTKDDTWYPLDDPRHPLNRQRREEASKGGARHGRK